MNLTFTLEQRFDVTPDGRAWINFGYKYRYWRMYLEVFDSVRVAGRARHVEKPNPEDEEVTGDGVTFAPLPYYLGPEQYLKTYAKLQRDVREVTRAPGAYLFRAPSMLTRPAIKGLRGRPYGIFVVGDPDQSGSNLDHWAKSIFKRVTVRDLKQATRGASVAAYVTERNLQQIYPATSASFQTHYSDVGMVPEAYSAEPKAFEGTRPAVLVFVGTLDALYKGQKELLEATASLVRQGRVSRTIVVGGGRYRQELEQLSRDLGIAENVEFKGMLRTPELVRAALDEADIFVLPSYTEGLPRATVEAMARGLPCVCSGVGGVVEILDERFLIEPHSAKMLTEKLLWALNNPLELNASAIRNLEKAKTFAADIQHERRLQFLNAIKECTQAYESRQR